MPILRLSEESFPMKEFTTRNNLKKIISALVCAVLWTALWGLLSVIVDRELLLPSPLAVAKRLFALASEKSFWIISGMSLLRIVIGFALGAATGTFLAVLTSASRASDSFFSPIGSIIRATPVASFIILALVWIKAANVPSFISFLMVTPIVWSALKTAIKNTDKELLEAAKMYRLGFSKTVKMIYLPSVLPQYAASLLTSLGLAWKSGIAAEVLCHPKLSVGTMLYESQIYLETADLFAWTATVIILSVIMEKCFGALLKKLMKGRETK